MLKIRPSLVLLFLTLALPAQAASVAEYIQQDLRSPGDITALACGESVYSVGALAHNYAARTGAPGWVDDAGPLPAAQQMLDAVRQSQNAGLRPLDYHFHALNSLLDAIYTPDLNADMRNQRLAVLDLMLSDAFLTLAGDELYGRVDPAKLTPAAGEAPVRRDLTPELQAVMHGADPQVLIQGFMPKDPGYVAMRAALARYRLMQTEGSLTDVSAGAPLRLGDQGVRVAALIQHLATEGDLSKSFFHRSQFGKAVESALKQYQSRHGLRGNGIAGADTLALINQPTRVWIDALRVNMDRLRRLPRDPPEMRLTVNIADFSAALIEKGGVSLAAKVIVGQPGRQTPEFNDWIRYLVVNPSWDVPPTIAAEDILPKLQQDPGYLVRHHIQVLQGRGVDERAVDPMSVHWKELTADTLPYHFRQAPGPDNPLGRVKFMFPNSYDVYLHDTPAQELFGAIQCTFSSGCIRVAHAMQLATALLRLDGQHDPAKLLADAVASGKTRQIDLSHPLPIYIVYLTAWVDETGMLEFRRDFYERDPQMLAALDVPSPRNLSCSTASD